MSQYSVEAILKATGAQEFSSAFKNATAEVQGFDSSTSKATGGIKNMMSGVGKIVAGIGITKALSAGFNLVKNSVGGAVERFDTLERYPKVMEQLGFSTDDSNKSVKKLSDGIQGLPTALNEVASTAQNIAIMTGDLEGATDTTLALNDAFLASGSSTADAKRGLDQYVQMLSKGEVDLQSWRTLQETMGLALNDVAKAFGFAGESAQNDLYAALKDGSITFDEFNNKLIELDGGVNGFAEKAKTASKGLKTSWQNIKTAVVTGVANMIAALNDGMIEAGFGSIADNLDIVKVAVQNGFKTMVESVGPFIGKLGELFETIQNSTAFQSLVEVFEMVKNKFIELKDAFLESEAFETIKQTFEDLGQAILDIDFVQLSADIQAFIDKWLPLIIGITGGIAAFKLITGTISAFKTTMDLAKIAVSAFSGGLALLTSPIGLAVIAIAALIAIGVLLWQNWDTIKAKLQELKDKFIADWEELKNIVGTAMTTLKDSALEDFEELKTGATDSVETLKTSAIEDFNELKTIGSNAMETLKSAAVTDATELKTGASNAIKTLRTAASNDFNQLSNGGKTAMSTLRSSAVSDANQLSGMAKSAVSTLRSSAVSDFNQLKDGGIRAWDTLSSSTSRIFNSVKSTITSAFDGIDLFSAGKAIIDGFLRGLKSAYEGVKSFVGGIASWIKDHKGPISYDRKLLIGAGNAIMEGLDNGLQSSFKDVQSTVSGMAGSIYDTMNTSPVMDINGSIARSNAQVKSSVSHELKNNSSSRLENAIMKLADQNIYLDGDTLVGGTYARYDKMGGNKTQLNERWGR